MVSVGGVRLVRRRALGPSTKRVPGLLSAQAVRTESEGGTMTFVALTVRTTDTSCRDLERTSSTRDNVRADGSLRAFKVYRVIIDRLTYM